MNKLKTSIGVFWINTICTLKCKDCITFTPYHKNPTNFPKENIASDIKAFFHIYSWVDHLDIEGGESLLHKDLPYILEEALKYKECFNRIHVLTNGTVIPSKQLLDVMSKNNIFVIIDDYGKALSKNIEEIIKLLSTNNIEYRVDTYNGDNQYFGGWVDFGDMSYKSYTNEELKKTFFACRQATCGAPYIKDGKMFLCSVQAAGLIHIPLVKGQYIDLHDNTETLEEKISIAETFGKIPLKTCEYCNGFNVEEGVRLRAAKQLTDEDNKELKACR